MKNNYKNIAINIVGKERLNKTMEQEEVRKLLLEYLTHGIKQTYISKLLDIPTYILSRFKSGKDLYAEDCLKLEEYLKKNLQN